MTARNLIASKTIFFFQYSVKRSSHSHWCVAGDQSIHAGKTTSANVLLTRVARPRINFRLDRSQTSTGKSPGPEHKKLAKEHSRIIFFTKRLILFQGNVGETTQECSFLGIRGATLREPLGYIYRHLCQNYGLRSTCQSNGQVVQSERPKQKEICQVPAILQDKCKMPKLSSEDTKTSVKLQPQQELLSHARQA